MGSRHKDGQRTQGWTGSTGGQVASPEGHELGLWVHGGISTGVAKASHLSDRWGLLHLSGAEASMRQGRDGATQRNGVS